MQMIELEVWKFITMQGGFCLIAIAAVLWGRGERAERIDYFKQLLALATRSVEGGAIQAASMDRLTAAIDRRLQNDRDHPS